MTLTERAEHEIKHLLMVSPETARALIADNARLREAIRQHREDTGEHMNLVDVHLYDVLKEGK